MGLCRKRGLLNLNRKRNKLNRGEILALLKAIWLAKSLSIVNNTQKGIRQKLEAIDLITWEVALEPVWPLLVLVALPGPSL